MPNARTWFFQQNNIIKTSINKEATMRKYATAKTVIVMTLVLILGSAGSALAYRGWGGGNQGGWGCPDDGYAMKRGGGPGQGDQRCPGEGYTRKRGMGPGYGPGMKDMSQEDVEKMTQLREAFFKDTKTLRSDLRSKSLELRSELVKEDPNLETVKNLQTELSALEAQMDQKRIEHRLEMKKVNPNAGKGFKMGYGPRGGQRGGNGGCWR
jgi:zinc resistance-associated protein